jgi:hypothetical protein
MIIFIYYLNKINKCQNENENLTCTFIYLFKYIYFSICYNYFVIKLLFNNKNELTLIIIK